MGLIYIPTDANLVETQLTSDLQMSRAFLNRLKMATKHLTTVVGGGKLDGKAYRKGLGLMQDCVLPTIKHATSAIDGIAQDLAAFTSAKSYMPNEPLYEDKLVAQIAELNVQKSAQEALSAVYQHHILSLVAGPIGVAIDLAISQFTDAKQQLDNWGNSVDEEIRKTQDKLDKLRQFNAQTSHLFQDSLSKLKLAMQGVAALNGSRINSDGSYRLAEEKKRKGFMIGKLFGVKHVTTDTNLTRDLGGSYQKVIRTDKDKGIFSANYKDGKFSGCSVELGGVSVDVDGWWSLSVGANTKLFGSSINARLALNLEGIDGGIGFGNAQNQFNYGLKGQSDLANGLFAVYAKNKTIVAKAKNLETSVTTEVGKRFLNGKQAVTAGVVTAVIIVGAVKIGGGLATGHPDIAEQGLQDVRNGVGKIVWGY